MTEFTLTSTTQCELCGAHLSSSDDECDHGDKEIEKHVFRRLHEGRESIVGVECTRERVWYALEEKIGEDWIAYQYLGTKDFVNTAIDTNAWNGISNIPPISTSADAPSDVGESED